jgi:hypothetical protein
MDNQQGTIALAYLGGIIDGEGSIYVSTHNYQGNNWATVEIKIANTNYELIDHISAILRNLELAHYVTKPRKAKEHHKLAKTVVITGHKRVYKFLPIVIPYLVIKRKQAILALRYVNSRLRNTSRKAPFLPEEIEILGEIKKLNQRGNGRLNDYTESFKDMRLKKI